MRRGIYAVHMVGPILSVEYPDELPGSTILYDWRRSTVYPSHSFDPDMHSTIPNGHLYSEASGRVCSLWPVAETPGTGNIPSAFSVGSTCVTPGKPVDSSGTWADFAGAIVDGDYHASRGVEPIMIEVSHDTLIPGGPGIPHVAIRKAPPTFPDGAHVELAAGSDDYLVLRTEADPLGFMVGDRKTGKWSRLAMGESLTSVRIFGAWLAVQTLSCSDSVCETKAYRVVDLRTLRAYPVAASQDSEVIGVDPDGRPCCGMEASCTRYGLELRGGR